MTSTIDNEKALGPALPSCAASVAENKELHGLPSPRSSITSSCHSLASEPAAGEQAGTPDQGLSAPPLPLTRLSSAAPSIVKVARSQRRGLFARFALIAEITTPTAYPRKTKWVITAIVATAGMCAPMGSAIVLPSLVDIANKLHATHTITNLSVALYMLALGIFPLWWSSFSETLGRRTIYLISFSLFTLFSVLCAVSSSISMFIVMRILSGGAAASVQAVGAGTIADMWEARERGRAMGLFYLGPLAGPFLAPIFGGALSEAFGWRSTQWFLVAYGGVLVCLILFALPETLKRRRDFAAEASARAVGTTGDPADAGNNRPDLTKISTRQSVQIRTKKWINIGRQFFIDPLRILLLLRFPAVAITVYWASLTFGALYFLNISIEETFAGPPYRFKTIIVGLLYIPNSLGYVTASIFGGRWIDYIMAREARKAGRVDSRGKLIYRPEDRMRENAWLSAILFPVALLWYGWTVQYGVHWIVPMIGNFFFGIGTMLIFAMATTMLTEFMPKRASNGIAVNNFARNIFSCTGGIIAVPAIHAIGNGWLCTILAIWALISGALCVWAMKRFGPRWREKMDRELLDQ